MEKVKAHDRYKHICYWVVQLLYFDGLESVISTQVGLFDSMCVRVLHLFYSTVVWALNFVHVQRIAHPQKSKTPSMNACKYTSGSFGSGTA